MNITPNQESCQTLLSAGQQKRSTGVFMIKLLGAALFLAASVQLPGGTAKIQVAVDQPKHAVPPELFGVFFEDINLSADGGLYSELVRNRSFEDAETPENWTLHPTTGAEISIDSSKPLNPLNRRSLRVKLDGKAQLVNEGYWGMNIVKRDSYVLKLAVRAAMDLKAQFP